MAPSSNRGVTEEPLRLPVRRGSAAEQLKTPPHQKHSGDMEPRWALGAEVNASRQLFPAPALPSDAWHPALAARTADGQGGCPKWGPCQPLPAGRGSSPVAARPFPRRILLLHLLSSPAQGQGNSGGGMHVYGITAARYSTVFLSLSLSAGLPRLEATVRIQCSVPELTSPSARGQRWQPAATTQGLGAGGRSRQLCGILICLSPSPLVLFVFTAAMANDTIPQTGSRACNRCKEPPKPPMEELWRKAKRLSELASGPLPGACVPSSAALTWGKLGRPRQPASFHRFSRRAKLPTQPCTESGFYLIPVHSQQRHCNPSLRREKPTSPSQPGGKQP